jgi:hypothetical protein
LAGIGAARRLPYTSGVCFLKAATTGQGRTVTVDDQAECGQKLTHV